jgi:hypothetical protein
VAVLHDEHHPLAMPTTSMTPREETGYACVTAGVWRNFACWRIPKGTNSVSLTAKIITTDTAEIVGAARAEFKADDMVRQLLAKTDAPTDANQSDSASPSEPEPPVAHFKAKVESLVLLPGDNFYGYAVLTIIVSNTSDTKTYGVAFPQDIYNGLNLRNSRGEAFRATDLNGVERAYDRGGQFLGNVTDIPPKSSITITSRSQVRWTGRPGDYRPYRLQAMMVWGEETQGRHPNLVTLNYVEDIK